MTMPLRDYRTILGFSCLVHDSLTILFRGSYMDFTWFFRWLKCDSFCTYSQAFLKKLEEFPPSSMKPSKTLRDPPPPNE
jgi:hypothetical protein